MIGTIENLADQMESFLSSPFLLPCEIAHYCIVIGGVKQHWVSSKARSQPLATWFASMACCFAGGVLVHAGCGKSPLFPFANSQSVIFATLTWWLIFYSPKSLFSSLMQWTPVWIVFVVLKELIRTRKIMKGVTIARSIYPSSVLLCTTMGVLAGCGEGFIKHCTFILKHQWTKDSIKTFSFSLETKCCIIFSLLYNLQLVGNFPITMRMVALIQAFVLFFISVLARFERDVDVFAPLERAIISLLIDYSAFDSSPPVHPVRVKTSKYCSKHRKEQ